MSQQQSSEALVNTLIGGAGGIGSKSQLDFDIDAGASKLDVQTSNTRDIFKDIDDTLIPTNSFISSILNSGRDLYVPEFQRKYSWDAENHDEFWSSILDIFTHLNEAPLNSGQLNLNPGGSDERLEEYYFGTLYIAEATNQKTDDEIYEVIDGQQRLATLFILLNEINHLLGEYEEQIGESDEYDGKLKDGVDYFRTGVIKQVLYKNPINEGNADFLRLKLTDHDDVYFKILFDNEIGTVLDRLDSLKDGGPPDWRTIRNIVDEDLNRGAELDDVQLKYLDGKDNHDSLDELLSQAKYRADPHELLLDARIEYKQRLKSLLDENLELDGGSYKKRAIALINLSILILSSFRVVECKFREPVDDTLKINVFQSLNETGTSLDFHDKIRARVVAKFEIGSDEAENFDNLVQEFGEKSEKIEEYLVDYLLATEEEEVFEKGTVSDNLLQIFSARDSSNYELTSRLAETEDNSPSDFIEEIYKNAQKYKEITRPNENGAFELNNDYFDTDTIQHECETILEDLDGDQWKPFVFLMYMELAEDSPIVSENFFRDMLRLVEKFMIRSSFSTSAATAIDQTFIAGCKLYNNNEIPEFDSIPVYNTDEDWIDDIEEFSDNPRRIMEAHLVNNSSWGKLSGGSFVRNLHNPSWSNPKDILKKLARFNALQLNQSGRSGVLTNVTEIEFSTIEREHVFPKKPRLQNQENPYDWFRNFFKIDDDGAPSDEIESLYNDLASGDDESEEASGDDESEEASGDDESEEASGDDESEELRYNRLKDLSKKYIEDVGNSIVLQDSLNNVASNRQFSIKILWYYLRSYHDLHDFNEYVGELENLGLEIEDFVNLLCGFEDVLQEGEVALLLKHTIGIFDTISTSDVNRWADSLDVSTYPPIEQSQFENEFSDLNEFYNTFDLTADNHSDLRDKFDNYSIDGVSLVSDEDDEQDVSVDEFINSAVGSVISNAASGFDETNVYADGDEDDSVAQKFNNVWNWETTAARKSELIIQIKKFSKLDTISDEFREYDSTQDELEYHQDRVKEAMRY